MLSRRRVRVVDVSPFSASSTFLNRVIVYVTRTVCCSPSESGEIPVLTCVLNPIFLAAYQSCAYVGLSIAPDLNHRAEITIMSLIRRRVYLT
jgi:hypothetical protein